jgi:hypothetical protein
MGGSDDVPFLPSIRQVYWINALIIFTGDREPNRPVVVGEVPALPHGMIRVVTRTSNTRAPGIPHDAAPELNLDKPGVFTRLAVVEQKLWTPRNVTLAGMLPAAIQREH